VNVGDKKRKKRGSIFVRETADEGPSERAKKKTHIWCWVCNTNKKIKKRGGVARIRQETQGAGQFPGRGGWGEGQGAPGIEEKKKGPKQ